MGQSVMQEDWFAVFQVQGHIDYWGLITYDCVYHIYWTFCNQI